MGNWYDGIGSGIGSMVDMFTGAPSGSTATGASAAAHHVSQSEHAQTLGKATGLAPFMGMLGMTPQAEAADDRMAKPSELRDMAAGKAPAQAGASGLGGLWDTVRGRGSSWSSPVVGDTEKNGFEKITNADGSSGGYKLPSYQNWSATGRSGGNRQSDIDARDHAVKVGMMPDNQHNEEEGGKVVNAPEIYQPDLSKLKHTTVGQKSIASAEETFKGSGVYKNNTGAGRFTDTAWGSHTDAADWGVKTRIDPLTGKGVTSIGSGGYQAGGEYKTGYRAGAMSNDKRFTADAEAGFVASGGVSGTYGLDTKNGAYATGGVGGKVGLYGQANADAKTKSAKFGGVDYDAGIGTHAEVFAGAKAGAGATVGLGPDFIGAKGNIGAFVGAEAAADVHGNLGPLAGKVGASGMAGAGIGADGDVSYKDGKFHIGGKMFAALGYGGSLSADMTVDVGAMGKSAYNVGATGLDYAGKGLNAAGKGMYDVGSAGIDYASKGLSTAGSTLSSGAHNLYNGASSLLSW